MYTQMTGSFDMVNEEDQDDVLGVSFIVKLEDHHISNVHLYSKLILIDRSVHTYIHTYVH